MTVMKKNFNELRAGMTPGRQGEAALRVVSQYSADGVFVPCGRVYSIISRCDTFWNVSSFE